MNSRRSFFKSLILSAVAPSILVPVLDDHQRWKRIAANPKAFEPANYYGKWRWVLTTPPMGFDPNWTHSSVESIASLKVSERFFAWEPD
jgi:hypothetical protein